jgi:hypothetical protein
MVICSLLALIFSPNLFLLSLNLQQFQVGGFPSAGCKDENPQQVWSLIARSLEDQPGANHVEVELCTTRHARTR